MSVSWRGDGPRRTHDALLTTQNPEPKTALPTLARSGRCEGQEDSELGAGGTGREVDLTFVTLCEAAGDIQPHSHSLSDGLGREERVEDPPPNLDRDARTIVEYPDQHAGALPNGGHDDMSARLDGIKRVVDQVRPDLI